jgi:hypothetical protein
MWEEAQATAGPATHGKIVFQVNLPLLCEALFASDLQYSEHPTPDEVRAAVRDVIAIRGTRRITAQVAQEFGDHPERAVARMLWARQAVSAAYRDHGPYLLAVCSPSVRHRICAAAVARRGPTRLRGFGARRW